ncbi:MAG: hypothetical protein WED07_00070 [Candidatus Freyarchaeum deiterrae]
MSELTSGFKMFERAPYKVPDSRAFTEAIIDGIRGEEKIYGPFFTTTLIKYCLKAVAKTTGENQSEDIKTLNQLTDYLLTKSNKLTMPPYFLLLWAQFVTDQKFEGFQAVGTQLMYKGLTQRAAKSEDFEALLKNVNVDLLLAKLRQLAVNIKVAPLEFGYKKNEDRTIDIIHGGCHFFEGCQKSSEQDLLTRPDGRMACGATVIVCQFLKMGTNHEWDYTILEFSEPHCVVKCFMI